MTTYVAAGRRERRVHNRAALKGVMLARVAVVRINMVLCVFVVMLVMMLIRVVVSIAVSLAMHRASAVMPTAAAAAARGDSRRPWLIGCLKNMYT